MRDYINELYLRRVNSKLALQQVADELGVNKVTLHYWENGTSKPRFDVFLKWCILLKVEL